MSVASENAGVRAARLFVLLSGGVLAGMVQLAILPSQTQMAEHFSNQGDGALIAQYVTAIAAPTMAFGAPLIGWLASRVGKRPVLLLSALLFAVFGALGAVAPDLWTLLATRVILGLAAAGFGTMAITYIGDYYTGERRDRMIGWYAVVGGAGSFVTLLAAGSLADVGGWRVPFALYLIGFLVFALAIPVISKATDREVVQEAGSDTSIRGAMGLYVLIVLIAIVMYMVTMQGPFLLKEDGITSQSSTSMIISMTTVGSMAGAYLFGLINPKLGFRGVLALTWASLGVGSVGFALTNGVSTLAIFAGLTGIGAGLMQPLTQSAVLNAVPSAAHARAIGLAVGCIFLGQFLHPLVLQPLREAVGFQDAFIWMGAAALIAVAITMLWRLRSPAHPAPASS
ncbi:MAG TPA: MFS transporter [Alphaproteobacteria bacterium]|nr:MFS transporter [Alphaproteobacteria bacterium]